MKGSEPNQIFGDLLVYFFLDRLSESESEPEALTKIFDLCWAIGKVSPNLSVVSHPET